MPPSLSASGCELFHQSVEEAYESAIHLVHAPAGHKAIWREYVVYLKSKALSTSQGFRALVDCVQRCVMDVAWSHPMQLEPQGSGDQSVLIEDYTFHNEVVQ